jgi:spermidine synthase
VRLFSRRLFAGRGPDHVNVQVSERSGVRYLHLGNTTVHSAMRLSDPDRLELTYTRSMMAALLFKPEPENVLIVGLGGGSLAKFVYRRVPAARITAVEVLPEVVAAARAYFHLPEENERLEVVIDDGARYVPANRGSCDLLFLDGFETDRQAEGLAKEPFYCACRDALRPHGLLAVNFWGSDPKFRRYLDRLDRCFGERVALLPAEKKGNVIAFAFHEQAHIPGWPELMKRAQQAEAEHGLEFVLFAQRLRTANPGLFD